MTLRRGGSGWAAHFAKRDKSRQTRNGEKADRRCTVTYFEGAASSRDNVSRDFSALSPLLDQLHALDCAQVEGLEFQGPFKTQPRPDRHPKGNINMSDLGLIVGVRGVQGDGPLEGAFSLLVFAEAGEREAVCVVVFGDLVVERDGLHETLGGLGRPAAFPVGLATP